jgi:hypothetical protein
MKGCSAGSGDPFPGGAVARLGVAFHMVERLQPVSSCTAMALEQDSNILGYELSVYASSASDWEAA